MIKPTHLMIKCSICTHPAEILFFKAEQIKWERCVKHQVDSQQSNKRKKI